MILVCITESEYSLCDSLLHMEYSNGWSCASVDRAVRSGAGNAARTTASTVLGITCCYMA